LYLDITAYEDIMELKASPLLCYSRLQAVLVDRGMNVAGLHRQLMRQGVRVNLKTLYRLTDALSPVERLDMGIAGAICRALKTELARLFVFESPRSRVRLQRLEAADQRRLDVLLEKQSEAGLTKGEEHELKALVDKAERLTLANARMLARARRSTSRA
jgi:hypothetical protein